MVLDARSAMADSSGADPTRHRLRSQRHPADAGVRPDPRPEWAPGDEVVVTRLDHDGNIRPWVLPPSGSARPYAGWTSIRTPPSSTSATRSLLTRATRLVAVTGASNLIGTDPDLPAIAQPRPRGSGRCCRSTPSTSPRTRCRSGGLGADILVCSPYKFCGPHLGVLVADPALLSRCARTSCCRRATSCRSVSSSARCRTSAGRHDGGGGLPGGPGGGRCADRPASVAGLRPIRRARAGAPDAAGAGLGRPRGATVYIRGDTADVDGAVRPARPGRRRGVAWHSPPRASRPRPAASTRSKRRGISAWATTVLSGPGRPLHRRGRRGPAARRARPVHLTQASLEAQRETAAAASGASSSAVRAGSIGTSSTAGPGLMPRLPSAVALSTGPGEPGQRPVDDDVDQPPARSGSGSGCP